MELLNGSHVHTPAEELDLSITHGDRCQVLVTVEIILCSELLI